MFLVEAHYHHSPEGAADQVRCIAHREEGLRDGERRDLYGTGPRYRAFRGDEMEIGGPWSKTHGASGSASISASS